MKDLVLMDINCKDARSFRLVTGKLFLPLKVIIIVRFLQRIKTILHRGSLQQA